MCDKLVIISPFLYPPKKEGRKKGERRSKNGFQTVFFVNQKLFTEMNLYFYFYSPSRKNGRDIKRRGSNVIYLYSHIAYN